MIKREISKVEREGNRDSAQQVDRVQQVQGHGSKREHSLLRDCLIVQDE